MCYLQNYIDHSVPWSDKEINEYVKSNSRIIKNGERIQFNAKAMLDNSGQPIPLDVFMVLSGQRVMLTPVVKPFITVEEYQQKVKVRNEWNKTHKGYKCVKASTFKSIVLAAEMSKALNN